jgi:hypothetical protein
MKTICLSSGQVALVDDEDYEWLSAFKWSVVKNPFGTYYAYRKGNKSEGIRYRKSIYMAREIMQCPDGLVVDHRNNTATLDNRKSNLRICTHADNMRNSKRQASNKCGLKGVRWHPGMKKWQARISVDYKEHHLGYFDNPQDAHEAYRAAAPQYHGEFARVA